MPFPYGKTLRPIDFNSNSADALAHGAALAMNSGDALYLMHVAQMDPLTTKDLPATTFTMRKVEHARTRLEHYAHRMPAAVKRELIVEIGEPGILIVAVQQRLGAELVVMSMHRRRGLKRLVLGSIAERIVHESTVPVPMVRAAAG